MYSVALAIAFRHATRTSNEPFGTKESVLDPDEVANF
jgi:hypothetical protein